MKHQPYVTLLLLSLLLLRVCVFYILLPSMLLLKSGMYVISRDWVVVVFYTGKGCLVVMHASDATRCYE